MAEAKLRVTWQRASLAVWDVICWLSATVLFIGARWNFVLIAQDWQYVLVYVTGAVTMQLIGGYVTKIYRGRHHVGSFEEALTIGLLAAAIAVVLGIGSWALAPTGFPLFVMLTVPIGALMLMGAGRFAARAYFTRHLRDSASPDAIPVLVYGAGNAGQQFGRIIQNDKDAPYEIVGYIDDDPKKQNLHLGPYKVLGDRASMVTLAADFGVKTIVMSMPTATRQLLREVSKITDREGLDLLVMPGTKDIVGGRVNLAQLHRIDMADLLGRRQIGTDIDAIAGYLTGRSVLVTGAGGSIGSELGRQVAASRRASWSCSTATSPPCTPCSSSHRRPGLLDTREPGRWPTSATPTRIARGLRRAPPRRRVPRRRAQAPAAARAAPGRGAQDQRARHPATSSTPPGPTASSASSTSPPTRPPTPPACSATPSASPRSSPPWYAGPDRRHATCRVRFGNVLGSRGSVLTAFRTRSSRAGRSPSPTPTSPATS